MAYSLPYFHGGIAQIFAGLLERTKRQHWFNRIHPLIVLFWLTLAAADSMMPELYSI